MSLASRATRLSEIYSSFKYLFILYERPFQVHMGNEPARLGEISPWHLSEVG